MRGGLSTTREDDGWIQETKWQVTTEITSVLQSVLTRLAQSSEA